MPKNDQDRKAKIVIKHYSTITLKPHAHLLYLLCPGGGGGGGRAELGKAENCVLSFSSKSRGTINFWNEYKPFTLM